MKDSDLYEMAFGVERRMPGERGIRAFRAHLESDENAAAKVVMMLYLNQTPDEQRDAVTIYDNHVGYDQTDAPVLTPLARKMWRGETLNHHELLTCRAHAGKYATQYLRCCIAA